MCFLTSMVPVNWTSTYVSLYKVEEDRYECTSFRGLSLLSVINQVYDSVVI